MNHSLQPGDSLDRNSSQIVEAPRLSHLGLTWMLIGMCLVPIVTLTVLWQILPPATESKLEARVAAAGLPTAEYYQTIYYERPPFEGGELVVTNLGDQEWTHLNIRINDGNYQIYDVAPIPPGGTARFRLERFITRTGASFKLQYNQLKNVQIFARRATRDRASHYQEFETVLEP